MALIEEEEKSHYIDPFCCRYVEFTKRLGRSFSSGSIFRFVKYLTSSLILHVQVIKKVFNPSSTQCQSLLPVKTWVGKLGKWESARNFKLICCRACRYRRQLAIIANKHKKVGKHEKGGEHLKLASEGGKGRDYPDLQDSQDQQQSGAAHTGHSHTWWFDWSVIVVLRCTWT